MDAIGISLVSITILLGLALVGYILRDTIMYRKYKEYYALIDTLISLEWQYLEQKEIRAKIYKLKDQIQMYTQAKRSNIARVETELMSEIYTFKSIRKNIKDGIAAESPALTSILEETLRISATKIEQLRSEVSTELLENVKVMRKQNGVKGDESN